MYNNLALRKKLVGELLKTIRSIDQQAISNDTFENGLHTVSSEPYYAEMAYKSVVIREKTIIDREKKCIATKHNSSIDNQNKYCMNEIVIAVDMQGKCHLRKEDVADSEKNWKCSVMCKKMNNEDKQSIINLKNAFSEESVEEVRDLLQNLDSGCEHGHYSKPYDIDIAADDFKKFNELKGHPPQCYTGFCSSKLRLL